jgi:hypothetical protein
LGKKLASPHPPTPDELKKLIRSSTTDAEALTWSSKAREKQESSEKTVYVYIGSATHHPGGLDCRRRYILSPWAKPHDEELKRKIKNLGLSPQGEFGTLFTVPFENNFGGHVLDVRALTILTRLHLMIWLGAVDGNLKSKTKHLVPWELRNIRYIELATPHPSLTVSEIKQRNSKPIRIHIWDDGWKIAEKNVTHSQTVEKVRYYMYKLKGVRPYDWEGTRLAVEECFDGAHRDSPPTLYLCLPEQASNVLPIEL